MKLASLAFAAFICLSAQAASACDHESINAHCNLSCNAPVRWGDHYDAGETRFAITTENGKVMLLLTDRVVAMQFSDRVLHKVDRKLNHAEDEEDDVLGRVIKTAVLTSVRSILSHSMECNIADIHNADYRGGRLILTTRNGRRLFAHANIDNDNVMSDFSESDARAFIRELQQRMRPQL